MSESVTRSPIELSAGQLKTRKGEVERGGSGFIFNSNAYESDSRVKL